MTLVMMAIMIIMMMRVIMMMMRMIAIMMRMIIMRMRSIEVLQEVLNRRRDKNQRFKNFFTFWVYLFYEPDGIGDMTKVMIMINLVLIMMVIMIMLIFLHAKVFQVALKVGLALLDLTHFPQI